MFSLNLEKNPVIYITRDIERALGLSLDTPGYFIISNSTPFAKTITANHTNVLLIESIELLDTHELLTRPETIKFIEQQIDSNILVFKNTGVIKKICSEHNWFLLNPSPKLSATVEEKISQIAWLGELAHLLPEHKIHPLKEVWFDGSTPFILQFNRAHTGNGTILIDSEKILNDLKTKFPDRPVRVTSFIHGAMLTSNNVVTPTKILVGNINYQITGLPPFTGQPFVTIGNDWALPKKMLSDEQSQAYHEMVISIGNKLRTSGWSGLFGTDIILEEKTGKLYLIEINARQPAGTTFETALQGKQIKQNKQSKQNGVTTFEAHLLSLLNKDLSGAELVEVSDGAQVILRNQLNTNWTQEELRLISEKLTAENFNVISYSNTAPGSDLLRIQSASGIMKNAGEFNECGENILGIIKNFSA